MGYISLLIRSLCIPRNGHVTIPSLLVWIYGHHDCDCPCHHSPHDDSFISTSACHHSLPSHYACVLLFYDHTIMILTILMTHISSYLSPTLPGLSLDLHLFNYSFLSRFCPLLLSPPHSLCHHSIFTYDVLSLELPSVMATLVYIV